VLLFALVGCRDATRPDALAVSPSAVQPSQAAREHETLDDEFARLAAVVPGGFAGMYIDANGVLVIALTDDDSRDAALASLDETIRSHTADPDASSLSSSVRVERVTFRWDELTRWRREIEAAAAELPGLVMTDIDEAGNVIALGFDNTSQARPVLDGLLRDNGIPANAVALLSSKAVQVTQILNDLFASVPGGVHAYRTGGSACTIGANVRYLGIPAFLTASHCSITQGVVDGGSWGHGYGTVILGSEIADPGTICYPLKCRRSDVAVIQYNGTHPHELGQIARTTWFGWYPPGYTGSDTINVAKPRFPLVSPGYVTSNPLLGEHVHRMGRRTGWLAGPINQTGVNVQQSTGWWMFGSYRFNGETLDGDSGAPVFFRVACPDAIPGSPPDCASLWAFIGVATRRRVTSAP
jgi:hypothetical protein